MDLELFQVAQIITNLTRQRGSLSTQLTDFSNHPEISLLQEICFGTCRWYLSLEFLLHKLVAKPIKEKDQDVKSLILILQSSLGIFYLIS